MLCISAALATLDRYPRGFTGHVAGDERDEKFEDALAKLDADYSGVD
jgi:hypothetical protein